MKKRILSLALLFLLLIALIPAAVAAGDFTIKDGVLIKYTGSGGAVTIPNNVKAIGTMAFDGNSKLTSIVIPDSVTVIQDAAFRDCTGLTSITIPNSVTEIWVGAFAGCDNLTSITLPDSITAISKYTFNRCSSLREITIPDSVERIGEGAFNFAGLTSIIIPDSVKVIDAGAFACSYSLTSVTLSKNVQHIADYAFSECTMLTSITIPNGVVIGSGAFNGCEKLTSVTFLGMSADIKDNAFDGCPNITLYGNAGSSAESLAKKKKIPFLEIGTSKDAPNLDTAATWAHESIKSAVTKGFVPNDLQDEYKNVITRAEFCRMAVKFVEYWTDKTIDTVLADKGVSRNPKAFNDTSDPDILAAFALGITNGTAPGTFTPDGQFSREQAATMFMRLCEVLIDDIDKLTIEDSGFADMDSVSAWAVEGVNFCNTFGIMNGTGDKKFNPKGTYTRQESIVTFDRL